MFVPLIFGMNKGITYKFIHYYGLQWLFAKGHVDLAVLLANGLGYANKENTCLFMIMEIKWVIIGNSKRITDKIGSITLNHCTKLHK